LSRFKFIIINSYTFLVRKVWRQKFTVVTDKKLPTKSKPLRFYS